MSVLTALPRKELFALPEGVIYLDGNSLGPLPRGAAQRVKTVMEDEWGESLITSWNRHGWMDLPTQVGNQIAPLIGAAEGTVTTGDTLSIKVFQAVSAALKMRPNRRLVLSDIGNFPSDVYITKGLLDLLGEDYELRCVSAADIESAIFEDVAAVLLTHVDYRSGRLYDMAAISSAAQRHGAVMIWDLAHSVGAVPVDLGAAQADFAVGCTYKYLNGGPGAPAFIYVRPDLVTKAEPALSGWLGHRDPFAMASTYEPAPSVDRMRIGTPAILQLAVLQEALAVWQGVDLADIRAASIALSERFIAGVEALGAGLQLASPRDPAQRGSHVSFAADKGYALVQALISIGVIGDFRPPNLMRFGFAPLYLESEDIDLAVNRLKQVLDEGLWQRPEYAQRHAVT